MSAQRYNPERKFSNIKKVQPFVPISVASREKKMYRFDTPPTESTSRNKQIEIIIDEDGTDKDCIKKLFKKIHSLTEQLAESQKERVRLQLELDHLSRRDFSCKDHEKSINKL